ncbi:hypothetical protein L916_15494, partial [Phytophthora nicotianae]
REMASRRKEAADSSDEQLWAAVRGLSDAELRDIQKGIRCFHCADGSALFSSSENPGSANNVAIPLQLGGKTQHVRVDDFVHVFLDFLHRQVQVHVDARISSDVVTSTAKDSSPTNMAASDNMATVATFDEEFPQLTPNTASKTTKRRITTTLLTPKDSTIVTRPVPAAISFPPVGVSESTRPPAWAKRSLLEKRMGAGSPAPSAWGPKPSASKPATTSAIVKKNLEPDRTKMATLRPQLQVRKKSTSNQVTHLQQEPSKHKLTSNQKEVPTVPTTATKKQTTSETEASVAISSADYQVNKQAAKLYGFLIRERFVKSTCAELQVLISLLYRADCTSCTSNASEFCWRSHCLDFAEIAFHEIESVLKHLGADLLGLVKQSLRDAEGICQDMLERLDCDSRRREELRVAESARIGCHLPVEMKASAVRDFALPFNEETDSRLHYRTPAESLLYTNREKVRDGFLSLLRQFQQQQHSLVGIENAGVAAAAIAAARELLADVSPENRWWFAKFFVQELVQVGSNPFGESDKDLVLKIMEDKLVVKNPDRLRKLHRRFSSQKPVNKSPQSTNKSGKVTNSLRKTRQEVKTNSTEDATKSFTATLERMKRYFTDNQLFFFHFLHSCDSYEFSELVKHQLERQFYAIRDAVSPSTDARKDFTEVVLRLKVVGKFLGYLRFSPQWQVTSSIRKLSAQNAAFQAVEREGISTLEVARDASLDVKRLLEDSIRNVAISKCTPWLCDYLSMLSLDRLSSGTTYFKQLMVLLQLLYRSPRLNALGETGLYIALQIQRIFRVLHLEDGFIHTSDYQSKDLQPSQEIRDALALKDEALGPGEDQLPFLYSQVFVQSCVSELDDLRGFIQTRAQPIPRRKLSIGSGSTTTGHGVTPIRKLRPLQVVIEDDTSSLTAKHDNAVVPAVKLPSTGNFPPVQEENDKLSEAVFKVHPKLKAVVDFVVANVTTDVCEHVVTHIVTPRADVLVDRCASESGLRKNTSVLTEDAAFAARASFQMLITSKTRHEANAAVFAALEEALRLGEERVSAAVPPFMPPSSHPTLTSSIVYVAMQRTRGALKTLVPKSSQTEFVKRVAFRNKSLLKDLGSASKATLQPTTNQEEQDKQADCRELRRLGAEMSRNLSQGSSLKDWEDQAAALLQSLSQFTSLLDECVSRDLTRDACFLRSQTLVYWDIVWRGVTSCVKFLSSSLDVFATCELSSMKDDRVESVEKTLLQLVTGFSKLLEVVVRSAGDDVTVSRVQRVLVYVMDSVMEVPSKLAIVSGDAGLVERFAVRTNALVVAKLRAVVSKFEGGDKCRVELNWDKWIEARDSLELNSELQFRRNVWDAATIATTAV